MNLPFQVAIQFHEVIALILMSFLLFVAGIYVSEKIKLNLNRKAIVHGSDEICGTCKALIESRKIPEMDTLQKKLRAEDGTLAKLDKTVNNLTTATEALKEDFASLRTEVSELRRIISADWQEQIKNLKAKLSEKDQQIRRLEDRG